MSAVTIYKVPSYLRTQEPVLPPPNACGAPDKFDQWRPLQSQAVARALESPKRFVIMAMPTGSGKSLMYMVMAALNGGRSAVLTSTKGLQQQLHSDYEEMGLVEIKGQNAYPCKAVEPGGELSHLRDNQESHISTMGFQTNRRGTSTIGCEEGPCHAGVQCSLREGGCNYYDALSLARNAQLISTNYSYFLTIYRYYKKGEVAGLGKLDMLVLDEGHDAPDRLSDFLSVELEAWEVEGTLATQFLPPGATPDQWREWAQYHHTRTSGKYDLLTEQIKENQMEEERVPREWLREAKVLRRIQQKLSMLASMKADWVCEHQTSGRSRAVKFSPIWPAGYAEDYLFRGIPKVIITSATIRPKTAEYLGIPPDQMEFIDFPSSFPKERRPLIHIPTVRLNARSSDADLRILLSRMDFIMEKRADRKGIIHTVSYQRARMVYNESRHHSRIIFHTPDGTRSAVERFKKSPPGTVIVSPSLTTGYDFPYDECEYQIIMKLPIPDSRGEVMQARSKSDPMYSWYLTMQTFVQEYGRGMRAEDDLCETFVVDDNIDWFLWKYKEFAPPWFVEAYVKMIAPPPAPARTRRANPPSQHPEIRL